MKILFIIYSLGNGGAERVTASLANRMVALGHKVTIAVLAGDTASPYEIDQRVRLLALDLAAASGNMLASVRNLGRRTAAISRLLQQERPDLAIGMMVTSAVLLGLARHPAGTTIVGSERAYPPAMPLPALWWLLRRFVYARLDRVVAQNGEIADWIREHTRARQVRVIGNPVSLLPATQPAIAPAQSIPADAQLVVSVGRLAEEKRFGHLLDAFAGICTGPDNRHLAILGEGPLRAELEARIGEAGLAGRIHLPGHVGNPRAWLERADLFAMSSRFEGMPNAMMEAMAHGLPVVSYDFKSGPRDLIDHGRNGLLVADGDIAGLAAAMAQLLDSPAQRQAMGRAATEILARFDPDKVAEQWLDLARPTE